MNPFNDWDALDWVIVTLAILATCAACCVGCVYVAERGRLDAQTMKGCAE